MELVIRVAVDSDVSAILRLYQEAGIGRGVSYTTDEACAQMKRFEAYPNYKLFVATIDGTVVGTYELLIMDNLAKRGLPSAIVEDVAVSPSHQGKGIGRVMMKHAMQTSKDAGCYKLVLSSNLERTQAHEFYDSVGFERHGISFRVDLS